MHFVLVMSIIWGVSGLIVLAAIFLCREQRLGGVTTRRIRLTTIKPAGSAGFLHPARIWVVDTSHCRDFSVRRVRAFEVWMGHRRLVRD
jgi:hypothetical protein